MRIILILFLTLAFRSASAEENGEFCGRYRVQGKFLSSMPDRKNKEEKQDVLVLNPNAQSSINIHTRTVTPEFRPYDKMVVDAEIEILSPECSFSCYGKIVSIMRVASPHLIGGKTFHPGREEPLEKLPCLKGYPKRSEGH